MATTNRTLNTAVRKTPKIQRTGDPHQLTIGPVPARKPRPTIALLREALNAFNVRGTCRLVAFEVFTYWEPGGRVFPSVQTIADGLGRSPRVVQRHMSRLERVGIWVRLTRSNNTNLYELRLPKQATGGVLQDTGQPEYGEGGGDAGVTPRGDTSVTLSNKGSKSELQASVLLTPTVRTRSQARPWTGAGSPLPESSADRKAAAAVAIAAFDAKFDPLTEAQRGPKRSRFNGQ